MITEANFEIAVAEAAARERREALHLHSQPRRQVDRWIFALEELMLRNRRVVPEPLYSDIAAFVWGLDARLFRGLRWQGANDSGSMLDALFDIQERLLPMSAPVIAPRPAIQGARNGRPIRAARSRRSPNPATSPQAGQSA